RRAARGRHGDAPALHRAGGVPRRRGHARAARARDEGAARQARRGARAGGCDGMSAGAATTGTAQKTPRAPEARAADGDQHRSRWLALYVLCLGMLMIVLDVTIVNVALPSIQEDLGFSTSSLAWVVNGYLISFGGLLLLA